MALSIYGTPEIKKLADGRTKVCGCFAWSTTDATGELNASGLKRVRKINFTPISGSYSAKDLPQLDETPASDGWIDVPSTGTLTVIRDAAGTSAGKCLYEIEGY